MKHVFHRSEQGDKLLRNQKTAGIKGVRLLRILHRGAPGRTISSAFLVANKSVLLFTDYKQQPGKWLQKKKYFSMCTNLPVAKKERCRNFSVLIIKDYRHDCWENGKGRSNGYKKWPYFYWCLTSKAPCSDVPVSKQV